MIRNFVIMLAFIVAAGVTPVLAQSYYVKKVEEGAEATQKKTTLYNKPVTQSQSPGKQAPKIKYKDKLLVKQQKIKSLSAAKSLEQIHELGLRPSNAEEVMFYAQANRAVTQHAVHKRREALMVALQKKQRKLLEQINKEHGTKDDLAEAEPVKVQSKTAVSKSKKSVDAKDKKTTGGSSKLFIYSR